jgi:hypothetical protein
MRLYALAFVKVNDVNVVGIAKAQNQKKRAKRNEEHSCFVRSSLTLSKKQQVHARCEESLVLRFTPS